MTATITQDDFLSSVMRFLRDPAGERLIERRAAEIMSLAESAGASWAPTPVLTVGEYRLMPDGAWQSASFTQAGIMYGWQDYTPPADLAPVFALLAEHATDGAQ